MADKNFRALGNFLGGGNHPNEIVAEAQGEQLGANTQAAIAKAQETQQKTQARADNAKYAAALPGSSPELGAYLGNAAMSEFDPRQGIESVGFNQKNRAGETILDPNSSLDQVARANLLRDPQSHGLVNSVGEGQLVNAVQPGTAPIETPVSRSIVEKNQGEALNQREQGLHPELRHFPPMGSMPGGLSPELQKAISEGRLDPRNLNSRTVAIHDMIAKNDPTFDFNAAHGGAVMQSNAVFQQKAGIVDTLPGNISHLVDLGGRLDYSPVRFKGAAEAWLKGELNDPALSEYMAVRNDTLMKLAATMRGVGMSDKAHDAEIEAMSPTLAPGALEGWARGQMSVISAQQAKNTELQHRNLHPGAPLPAAAPAAPAISGAAPTAFADEAAAEKANLPDGTPITVGGVKGVWKHQ